MSARNVVREILRATRRKFIPEEKIRIVLEGLRGAVTITELRPGEGIVTMYYRWPDLPQLLYLYIKSQNTI